MKHAWAITVSLIIHFDYTICVMRDAWVSLIKLSPLKSIFNRVMRIASGRWDMPSESNGIITSKNNIIIIKAKWNTNSKPMQINLCFHYHERKAHLRRRNTFDFQLVRSINDASCHLHRFHANNQKFNFNFKCQTMFKAIIATQRSNGTTCPFMKLTWINTCLHVCLTQSETGISSIEFRFRWLPFGYFWIPVLETFFVCSEMNAIANMA